jgi:hypothetical protein
MMMKMSVRSLRYLSLAIAASATLAGCTSQPGDDLAVAKLPQEQMLATAYLPLNADKPGTAVEVEKYLVPGKYTLVYFFSPYSGSPLDAGMQQLAQRPDLAVRTVNVNRPEAQGVDYQSPIMLSGEISTLPYIRIYDPSLKLRAHGRPAYEQVMQWLRPATAF